MILAPAQVLFPSGWFVLRWQASVLAIVVLTFTADGADWFYISAMLAAALWAGDILRRLRQWAGGALVPGYASTAFATAAGIVASAALLGGLLAWAAGNPKPAFAFAALAGAGALCVLGCAERLSLGQTAAPAFALVAAIAAADYYLSRSGSGAAAALAGLELGAQATAIVGAIAAFIALRRHLARPPPARRSARATSRQFRPWVVSPRHLLLGVPLRPSESFVLCVTAVVCVQFHVDAPASASGGWGAWGWRIQIVALALILAGSLTPLVLMKGAGAWLGTAWRLGRGASRAALGRAFMARILLATACSFAISLGLALLHAYAGGEPPLQPSRWPFIEELVLVYAVGLLGAGGAALAHPARSAGAPSILGVLVAVCIVDAVVVATAPDAGTAALLGLGLLLAASAVAMTFGGGRAIGRVDFIAGKDP